MNPDKFSLAGVSLGKYFLSALCWRSLLTMAMPWLLGGVAVSAEPALQTIQEDWLKQEAGLKRQPQAAIAEVARKGRALAADLKMQGLEDEAAACLQTLADVELRMQEMPAPSLIEQSGFSTELLSLYYQARWAVRRLVFKNPLLHANEGLLFVRRHYTALPHQAGRRRARHNLLGGEICILKNIRADGQAEAVSITKGRFPEGLFSRPDISYDGKRMVFGFADANIRERVELLSNDTMDEAYRESLGNKTYFQLWEMALGEGMPEPRLILKARNRWEESTDPIYLPNGRVGFMSPRAGGLVQCADWATADTLFTVDPDGGDLRPITISKDGEWDPSVMDDGTILFTRWEYTMRSWAPTQLMWQTRPDGTNPHVAGGFLTNERNYAMCRQIPGFNKVVCVEAHHHNDGSGNIMTVDLSHGRDSTLGHVVLVSGAGDCPYPLSDKYFLISYDPGGGGSPDRRQAGEMGIYIADTFGTLELVYQESGRLGGKAMSAMYPMPIRPRKTPPILPEAIPELGEDGGVFFVQNVHEGLPQPMQGKARHIQIVQAHERLIRTAPCNLYSGVGGFETKTVLGTVPVERDGSACFRVPAGKTVFFSVLDENYEGLHTMRMTTDIKRGERMGCIGCHEPVNSTPRDYGHFLALNRAPSAIAPPPWGVQTFGFPKLVQPILDQHCVKCHDGTKKMAFDLRAPSDGAESFVTNRYRMDDPYEFNQAYRYGAYWTLLKYVKIASIFDYLKPPGTWGSRVSPLIDLLTKNHYEVKLSETEWRILCTWIDCNCVYLDNWEKYSVDPKIREPAKQRGLRDLTADGMPVSK